MSEISKSIDKFIKENLSEDLKTLGFRKKRRSWYRKHNTTIEKICIEASTWNIGNEGIFWVSLSVYKPEIAKVFGREIEGDEPKGYEFGIATLLVI